MDKSGEKEMKMKLLSQKKCKKRKEREEVVSSCKTSKPFFPMDDEPEMKLKMLLLSLKDLLSEYADCGVAGRTIVNGCDTKLLEYVVETALTNFASPSQKEEEAIVASCKTSKPLDQLDKSVEKEMSQKKCEKRKEREVQSKKKKRKERAEVVASGKTRKPLPMDKSGEKEMKLVKSVRGYAVPGCGEVGRIIVSGYDTSLPKDVVKRSLIKHFSTCGEITDVYVPINFAKKLVDKKLVDISYIYFVGEGAVEKALDLNKTDVGGWTVNVEPYPFEPDAKHTIWLVAEGFDTSFSKTEIEDALIQHFSSCGRVYGVIVSTAHGQAVLNVKGEDAAEKVPKLNGSSFMGDHKLVLRDVCYEDIQTVHIRPLGPYCGRK